MWIISWGHRGPCYPQRNLVPRWCREDISGEATTTDSSPTTLMESTLTPLSGCPKDGDHLYPAVLGTRLAMVYPNLLAALHTTIDGTSNPAS